MDNNKDECACPYFCGEIFRNWLPVNHRRVVQVLHEVFQKKCVDVKATFENVLKTVEDETGLDSFVYGIILIKISELESDIAVKLAKQRLQKLKCNHFATLMLLGIGYEKRGEFPNSLDAFHQANAQAKKNGSSLQDAVSLVRLARTNWNFRQPEVSHQLIDKAQAAVAKYLAQKCGKISDENLYWEVLYYKNMAYLRRMVQNDPVQSLTNYFAALNLIENHVVFTAADQLAVLGGISLCYNQLGDKLSLHVENKKALGILENIINKTNGASAHASGIIHVLSEISYCTVNDLEALAVKEKMLSIARDCYGDANPEVARIAAGIIVLHHKIGKPREVHKFVDIFHKSLFESNYRKDPKQIRVYPRELTDALKTYAYYTSLCGQYKVAERYYKEAIAISSQVFGENNPRTAMIQSYLGKLYYHVGQNNLAIHYLKKSVSVIEKCKTNNGKLIKQLKQTAANAAAGWKPLPTHYKKHPLKNKF